MSSVFTRIINGELPGRFVHTDDTCVAFLTVEPLSPGHTLVVPRDEVDHWLDLNSDIMSHLMTVAQRVGRAINTVYQPQRVGMMIAGLEVPHVHIHVTALNTMEDLDFGNVNRDPSDAELDEAANLLSAALKR